MLHFRLVSTEKSAGEKMVHGALEVINTSELQ